MDFGLTEEQRDLQKWAHEFAEKEIRPVAPEYDESEDFPWDVLKKAAQTGIYGIDLYLQSQQDSSGLTLPLVFEELFWGCAGISLSIVGTGLPLTAL
jgi:acyl-CoA dehydrogenase